MSPIYHQLHMVESLKQGLLPTELRSTVIELRDILSITTRRLIRYLGPSRR
jgi:hypothetical protein